MVMLASLPAGAAVGALADLIAVSVRTVRRWRRWYQRDFQRAVFWQSVHERFARPVPAAGLPQSPLERFQGLTGHQLLLQLLHFTSPLSTPSVIK